MHSHTFSNFSLRKKLNLFLQYGSKTCLPSFWKTAFRDGTLSKFTFLYSSSSVTVTGSPESDVNTCYLISLK